MGLSSIVDVQITRQTASVSQAGFGTMMILGFNATFPERIRFYEDMDGVATDFATSDEEYKAATAAFSQNPRPNRLAIGRAEALTAAVYLIDCNQAMAGADSISVTVNGTVCTASTLAALATAIDAVAGVASAVVAGTPDFTITITADVGTSLTVSTLVVTTTLGLTATLTNPTPEKTVVTALDAIVLESDDWYALTLTIRTLASQMTAAAWIEARRKIFFARSNDANCKSAVETSDVAYKLKAAAYDRSVVIAHYPTTDDFIDAGWLGKMLPEDPGSATFKFKTIAGATVDNLSASESTAIKGKNGNTYELIGGVNITAEGIVASGEFIDIIIGIDWLQARIEERVYAKLVQLKKIPFTDAGVAIIENELRAQLKQGVAVGLLAADPEFTVTVPKVADVSPADKALRYLPGITFAATLAGAVHKTQIRGTVSI
jgi:hypothetical protein